MKLHLGCGSRWIPGYFHVDAQPHPHVDLVGPVDRLPFPDQSADLVYASHVLEHFGRHHHSAVLAEWRRVLKPGAVLRLSVPDFQTVAELYVGGGLPRGLPDALGLICGGQRNEWDFHKMVFDEALLTEALCSVGFQEIRRWDWRSTEHASVDDYSQAYLPHMDKVNGHLVSLNLEAVR